MLQEVFLNFVLEMVSPAFYCHFSVTVGVEQQRNNFITYVDANALKRFGVRYILKNPCKSLLNIAWNVEKIEHMKILLTLIKVWDFCKFYGCRLCVTRKTRDFFLMAKWWRMYLLFIHTHKHIRKIIVLNCMWE